MKSVKLRPLLFLIFIQYLAIPSISAQEITIENASKKGLKGVRIMDQNGYYVQFAEKTEDEGKKAFNFRFVILNNDLGKISEFSILLPPREEIEDVTYNDGKFFLATSSKKEKTRTFRLLDKSGKEIAKHLKTDVKKKLLNDPVDVQPLENGDFLVLNYLKEKKVGYSLERYDAALTQKYEEIYTPDIKQIDPVDMAISGEVIFVLEHVTQNVGGFFQFNIAGYNLNDGKEIFNKEIKSADDEAHGYASFLKISPKGKAITGGLYFKGNTAKNNKSPGFFGAVIDAEGNFNFRHKTWEDVKDRMEDYGKLISWMGPQNKALLHDIIVYEDGAFSLIGQVFNVDPFTVEKPSSSSSNSGTSTTQKITNYRVDLSDFLIMDFDPDANFTNSRLIIQPEFETVVKPKNSSYSSSQTGDMNLARILNNYNVFPYKFTINSGENRYVIHSYFYSQQFKEELYFTDLKTGKNMGQLMDITPRYLEKNRDRQKGIDDTFGKWTQYAGKSYDTETNIFYMESKHSPWKTKAKIETARSFPSNVDGKIILFDLLPTPEVESDPKALNKWLSRYSYDADGNLKIWYIDVPK